MTKRVLQAGNATGDLGWAVEGGFISDNVVSFLTPGTALSFLRLTSVGNKSVIGVLPTPTVSQLWVALLASDLAATSRELHLSDTVRTYLTLGVLKIHPSPTASVNPDYVKWLFMHIVDARKQISLPEGLSRISRVELPLEIDFNRDLLTAYQAVQAEHPAKHMARKIATVEKRLSDKTRVLQRLLKAKYLRERREHFQYVTADFRFYRKGTIAVDPGASVLLTPPPSFCHYQRSTAFPPVFYEWPWDANLTREKRNVTSKIV